MDKELLADKATRVAQSNRIGTELYGEKWALIINSIKELDPTFAQFVQEVPYGSVYPRKQFNLPMREVVAISSLTQLNLKPQLKSHIIAARNVGLSRQQIIELFLHLAMFIGFPLVLDGLRVAKEVFDREDEKSVKD